MSFFPVTVVMRLMLLAPEEGPFPPDIDNCTAKSQILAVTSGAVVIAGARAQPDDIALFDHVMELVGPAHLVASGLVMSEMVWAEMLATPELGEVLLRAEVSG